MVEIFRNAEGADDSRPSDRAREGSSRLQRLLRVGAAPWRAPPTAVVVRGRIAEVQNLCHPLSTTGKVPEKLSVQIPRFKKAKCGYNNVLRFSGDTCSFSAMLLTYKTQQENALDSHC